MDEIATPSPAAAPLATPLAQASPAIADGASSAPQQEGWQQLVANLWTFYREHWLTITVWLIVIGIGLWLFLKTRGQIRKFVFEVRTELAKASWPWDTKERGFKRYKELTDSTMVVLIAMLLLSGYVALWDFLLVTIVGRLTH